MPLTRGGLAPRVDMWGVFFQMFTPAGSLMVCSITRGALDTLAKGDDTTTEGEQTAIFEQWHEEIETLASAKFDRQVLEHGMIVLRPEDVTGYFE